MQGGHRNTKAPSIRAFSEGCRTVETFQVSWAQASVHKEKRKPSETYSKPFTSAGGHDRCLHGPAERYAPAGGGRGPAFDFAEITKSSVAFVRPSPGNVTDGTARKDAEAHAGQRTQRQATNDLKRLKCAKPCVNLPHTGMKANARRVQIGQAGELPIRSKY